MSIASRKIIFQVAFCLLLSSIGEASEQVRAHTLFNFDHIKENSAPNNLNVQFQDADVQLQDVNYPAGSKTSTLSCFNEALNPGIEYKLSVSSSIGKTFGLSIIPPQGFIAEINGSLKNGFYTTASSSETTTFRVILRSTEALDPASAMPFGKSTGISIPTLRWRVGLGHRVGGSSAGFVDLKTNEVTEETFTRASLSVCIPPHNPSEMTIIYDDVDQDGNKDSIRQIRNAECLADFVDTAWTNGKVTTYEIRFYGSGTWNHNSGNYDPAGTPLVTYEFSRVSGNKLKIRQIDAAGIITSQVSSTLLGVYGLNTNWLLSEAGGEYTRTTSINSGGSLWVDPPEYYNGYLDDDLEIKYTQKPSGLPASADTSFKRRRRYDLFQSGAKRLAKDTFNVGTAYVRTDEIYHIQDPRMKEFGLLGSRRNAFGKATTYAYEQDNGQAYYSDENQVAFKWNQSIPILKDLADWMATNEAKTFIPTLSPRYQKIAFEYSPETSNVGLFIQPGDYANGRARRKLIHQGFGWNELEPVPVRIEEDIRVSGVSKLVGRSMGKLLTFPLNHNPTTGESENFIELSALYDVPDRNSWPTINQGATRWTARHVPSAHAQAFDYRLSMKPYMEINPTSGKTSHAYSQINSYEGIPDAWVEVSVTGLQPSVIQDQPNDHLATLTNPVNGAVFNNGLTIPLYYDMIGRLADLPLPGNGLLPIYPGPARNAMYLDARNRYVSPVTMVHNNHVFNNFDSINLIDGKSTKIVRAYTARGAIARVENWVYVGSTWRELETLLYHHDSFGRTVRIVRKDGASAVTRVLYEADYLGLNLAWEKDALGVKTTYSYDGLGRVSGKITSCSHSIARIPTSFVTSIVYDALDRVIQISTGDVKKSWVYDAQGLLLSKTDENGLTTTYSYSRSGNHGMQVDIVHPGGATEKRIHNQDGRLQSVTGTAVISTYLTYSYDESGGTGNHITRIDTGLPHTDSVRHPWRKISRDWNGRITREESPTTNPAQNHLKTYQYGASNTLLASTTETDCSQDGTTISQSLTNCFEYDANGQLTAQGLDIDGGGLSDASLDRLTRNDSVFVYENDAIYIRTSSKSFPKNGDATSVSGSKSVRLNNFPGNTLSEVNEVDPRGNITTSRSEKIGNGVVVTTVSYPDYATEQSISVVGLAAESVGRRGERAWKGYDSSGRLTLEGSLNGSVGNSTRAEYFPNSTRLWKSVSDLAVDGSGAGRTTVYAYDNAGNISSQTNPDGSTVYYSYNLRGQMVKMWGTSVSPIWLEYGSTLGSLQKQYTWPVKTGSSPNFATATSPPSGSNVVEFSYDSATGYLLSRSDGFGTSNARVTDYTYNVKGQISTIQTPSSTASTNSVATSRITISRQYLPKTNELALVTYNDNLTPSKAFTWHRSGALASATENGTSTWTYNYNHDGENPNALTLESVDLPSYYTTIPSMGGFSNGDQPTDRIVYNYGSDANMNGVFIGSALGSNPGNGSSTGISERSSITYIWNKSIIIGGYITTSLGVSNQFSPFNYTHDETGSRLTGRSVGASIERRTYTKDRGLLENISTTSASSLRASFDYQYDAMGRRSSSVQQGSFYKIYGGAIYTGFSYDSRGGLTGASSRFGLSASSPQIPGRSFGYDYDLNDNRRTVTRSDAPSSATSFEASVNSLNQIASRATPQWAEISGTAMKEHGVAILGSGATVATKPNRNENYFHSYHTPSGATTSVRKSAVELFFAELGKGGPDPVNVGQSRDVIEKKSLELRMRPSADVSKYDARGNLRSDALWNYTWDAENSLISVESSSASIAAGLPKVKLSFNYDWMGRRYSKSSYSWTGSAFSINPEEITYYWWDEWKLQREAKYSLVWSGGSMVSKSLSSENLYHWGLDISGGLGEDGGIGGLLAITSRVPGQSSGNYYPVYDGNGNIVGLLDAFGSEEAIYEYDPYGNRVRTSGPAAKLNPFGFATKYFDSETNLIYFDNRYYSPETGRFISRDPLGEDGGINNYAYAGNDPINGSDYLGLQAYSNAHASIYRAGGSYNPDAWALNRLVSDNVQGYLEAISYSDSLTGGMFNDVPMGAVPMAAPYSSPSSSGNFFAPTVIQMTPANSHAWARLFDDMNASQAFYEAQDDPEPTMSIAQESYPLALTPSSPSISGNSLRTAFKGSGGQMTGSHGDIIASHSNESSATASYFQQVSETYAGMGVGAWEMAAAAVAQAWDVHPFVNAGQALMGRETGYARNFQSGKAALSGLHGLATSASARERFSIGVSEAWDDAIRDNYSVGKLIGKVWFTAVTAAAVTHGTAPSVARSNLLSTTSRVGKATTGAGGDLSESIVRSFRNGQYSSWVADTDVILYRATNFAQDANGPGRFFGLSRPVNSMDAEMMYNLKSWGNNATELLTYRIPAGTKGYIGSVNNGTGIQLFIPNTKSVRLLDQSSLFINELKFITPR